MKYKSIYLKNSNVLFHLDDMKEVDLDLKLNTVVESILVTESFWKNRIYKTLGL